MPLLGIPLYLWLIGGGAVAGAGVTYVASDTVKNTINLAIVCAIGYAVYKGAK